MSYKFSALMLCDGNLEAFERSLSSLNNMHGYLKETQLFVFFKNLKYKYQIPIQILKAIKELGDENIILVFEKDEKSSMEQLLEVIENNGSQFLFFIREGDELDEYYLTYVESIFAINKDKCGVVYVPIIDNLLQTTPSDQNTLPQTGVIPFEEDSELPLSSFGVSILTSVLANITLPNNLNEEHCLEIVIKSILQTGCYGRINAVTYISNSHINKWDAEILVSLAEFSKKTLNYVPKSILSYIFEELVELLFAPCTCEEELIQNKNTLEALLSFVSDEYLETSFIWSDNRVNEFLKSGLSSYKKKNNNQETFNLSDVEVFINHVENCYNKVKINGYLYLPRGVDDLELSLYQKNSGDDTVEAYLLNIKHETVGNTLSLAEEIIAKMSFDIDINFKNESAEIYFYLKSNGVSQDFVNVKVIGEKNYVEGKTIINNYYLSYSNDNGSLLRIEKIAPRANYLVSCIMPIYNVEMYLREAIDSVIGQTIGFEENIQLIMINDGSPDNSRDICLEYKDKYPENVVFVEQENAGVSAARNKGLDLALGEYVSFLDGDDLFDPKHLEVTIDFIKAKSSEIDLVAVPYMFFGNAKKDAIHPLNYKFTETKVADLFVDANYCQLSSCCTVIKKVAIGKLRFNKLLKYCEDGEFLHKILIESMKYGVVKEPFYFYRKRYSNDSAVQSAENDINWYDKLTLLYPGMISESIEKHSYVSRFTQYTIMYDLQWYGIKEIDSEIVDQIDTKMLLSEITKVLQYIDDDIIQSARHLSYWQKFILLELKHNDLKLEKSGIPTVNLGGKVFEKMNPVVWIVTTEEFDNIVHFSGIYNIALQEDIELCIEYRNQFYQCETYDNHLEDAYFLGQNLHKASNFDFYIPYLGIGEIKFFIKIGEDGYYPVKLRYAKRSNLNDKQNSFFIGSNTLVSKAKENNILKIEPLTEKVLQSAVIEYLQSNYTDKCFREDSEVLKEYLFLYPILSKKRIWIFMDRYNKADDNAEHLFNYCSNIEDGIDKYFILDKDSTDITRLQGMGNVVYYGSKFHKLLYLFAEKIVSSHFDEQYILYPFKANETRKLYSCLIRNKFVFLQHGITKDNMSPLLHRSRKNINLFVTASPFEYQSILDNGYGYDKSVVKLTGFPRYDKLYDDRKRKILFMPTWKKDLSIGFNLYNPDFKNSDYCMKINDFLNDETLIKLLEKNNYTILFMPHPNTYIQIEDFITNKFVEIAPYEVSYQKLFAECDLGITDYSSAIFDFAYLKKPIVYYQFIQNHYNEGYFNYETMGFGEVVLKQEDLIEILVKYLESDCQLEDKYLKRINEFYAYFDQNNCKRVYDEIIKI